VFCGVCGGGWDTPLPQSPMWCRSNRKLS